MSNAFTAMVVGGVVEVVETTHIPANQNKRADGLSKHRTAEDLELGSLPFVDLNVDPIALQIRELCDPAHEDGTDECFVAHWRRSIFVAFAIFVAFCRFGSVLGPDNRTRNLQKENERSF